LMFFWFFVSFGCGIIFKDFLDQFQLGGFPLGFWFAQQGSVYAFIVIIAAYIIIMNKLDKKYNLN
jgi:putative solute:sodium symporter small subunit